MKINIAVLPGDGVGPEVVAEAVKVLNAIGLRYGHDFVYHYGNIGGAAIDREGVPLAADTLKMCKRCASVLLGAVGGPKWDDPLAKLRPEDGLLHLRKALNLFANLRPVKVLPILADSTPLKPSVITGADMIVVRELTGGLYFGRPKRQWRTNRGRRAIDSMSYSEIEIEQVFPWCATDGP